MLASDNYLVLGAARGFQDLIHGTCLNVAGAPQTSDVQGTDSAQSAVSATLMLAGRTLTQAGTYYFFIPSGGSSAVDVTLRTSSGGANITAASTKVYRVMSDYVTEKMGPTGSSTAVAASAFSDGTQQTISVTGLRGERGVLLKLVTTGNVTFDQAEFSAL